MNKKNLIKHLESIFKLLEEEKKVLIENDGDALFDIIKQKDNYIKDLEKFKGSDLEDEKIKKLIEEIDSLQEINLLLTKQALSFQENFLESLSKASKNSNTHSNVGNYEKNSSVNIVEKEV